MTALRARLRKSHLAMLGLIVATTWIVPSIPGMFFFDPTLHSPSGWLALLVVIGLIAVVGEEPVADFARQAPGGIRVSRVRNMAATLGFGCFATFALAAVTSSDRFASAIVLGGLMWVVPTALLTVVSARVLAPAIGVVSIAATIVLGFVESTQKAGAQTSLGDTLVPRRWALPLRPELLDITRSLAAWVAIAIGVAMVLAQVGSLARWRRNNTHDLQ